ncbi:MAG: carboxyl-terminal protease [Chitinophagaceae bacterium]|nr:carboxyl-terminal protease [Chitinophagaceae bacterium]
MPYIIFIKPLLIKQGTFEYHYQFVLFLLIRMYKNTIKFIMSKKFLPVLFLLIGAGVFFTVNTMGRGDGSTDNPKSKNEKILRNVGIVLEQGHYSPKKIDDAFSKEVFKKYIEDLDPDKYIFMQKDIDGFKKYETKIDDEIHGANLESYYAINNVYISRLDEGIKAYKDILSKPFTFTADETIVMDGDKRTFPKSEAERYDYGRKRLKYLVLSRYSDMLDDREKNIGKAGYIAKADSTLEREARQQVIKQMDRYFSTLKSHNTPDAMFSDFVNSITGTMDPHTTYFAPVDKRSFDELLSGTFYGIGAQLKEDDGKIKIASLVTGGPAWKSGNIIVEDEIIKIAQGKGEPVDVTGYSVTDAVKLIRGAEKNSEVKLTLKKPDGTTKVVSLLRDKISLEDTFVKSAIVNGTHKIGYIYLPEFYANFDDPQGRRCAVDVAKEIEKLKAENVEGIVMDLRGNGGGSLYDVVDMAGLFIEDGPICQVKGRDEKPMVLNDRDKSVLYTGPLTVMVDELSASASEIFAAAIQDYNRGIVIGSTSTYGKGTVQRSVSLDPEAENVFFKKPVTDGLGDVKLTFRKFYRVNGGATQLRGVTPDIVVPDRLEYLKFREKDNPDALSWDVITKADYTPWNPGYDVRTLINKTNVQLNSDTTFKLIKNGTQLLEKNADRAYSLNLQKYRDELKQLRTTVKDLDSITKLKVDLNVTNATQDVATIQADKDKTERNKQWLKRVSSDIYIGETIKVMDNMIGQAALAKAK